MKKFIKIITLAVVVLSILTTCVWALVPREWDDIELNESATESGETVNPFQVAAVPIEIGFVSKGIAMLLLVLQVLQYVVPIILFITMLILNKGKNNVKMVLIYLIMSIVFGFAIVGTGFILEGTSSSYGYSSMSAGYINYNGKIIYYHK